MSSVNSLKKKCRHLEERGRWADLSRACSDLARLLRNEKKLEEALHYYRKDRDLCIKLRDEVEEAEAIRMIGEVLVEQGKFSEALSHHTQYLDLARSLSNAVTEQRALATLGWTYLTMSQSDPANLEKALKYSAKCLKAVSRIPSKDVEKGERYQMTGRAQENIGKIHWRLGSSLEAEQSFSEAEENFRGHRHWDDLHRLAVTRAGLILEAGSEMNEALRQCRISVEAAQKLREPLCNEASVESLITMFKVNLVMKQFHDAGNCLVKARTYKVDKILLRQVEQHLKMMTVISRGLDKISKCDSSSILTHLPYEQIADALVKFTGTPAEKKKILELALEYYTMAFGRASSEGSMECLPALNNSVAKTYEDLRDFDNALAFYEKQLELERGSPEDQCVTWSSIAMVRESMKSDYEVVMEARRSWLNLAISLGNRGQELEALQEMFRYQRDAGHTAEAEETRLRIEELGGGVEDDTGACSQGSVSSELSDKFPEVSLSDLDPPRVETSKVARRTPPEYLKKNKLGESPLHVEIQRPGRENKIRDMIERGHPLEVDDNAGWTPLGDAVGRMNISYVKIITEAGANLDHRNNEGETPLIAACQHGFLDGAEHLLDCGAKVDIKTRKGDTALGYLKNHLKEGRMPDCHEDYRRPGVMERLESLVTRIERKFTNLGLSTDVTLPLDQDSPALEDLYDGFNEEDNDKTLVEDPPAFCSTQRNRIRSPSPSSTSSLGSPVSRSPIRATQMYQEAMSNIGSSRNVLQTVSSSRTPILNMRTTNSGVDIGNDDWLVDDLSDSKKKRKRPSIIEDVSNSNSWTKKSRNIENQSPAIDLTLSPTLKPVRNRLSKSKRAKQPLISSLLPRSRTPSPLPPLAGHESPPRWTLSEFTPAPTQPPSVTSVKILVNREKLNVPVTDPSLTVSWLAKEAATRYWRLHNMEPVLSLRTEDGAALDPTDPLSHILATCQTISGEVLHWNMKPASEMYRDTCRDLKLPCFKNLSEKLSVMSSSNKLSLRLSLRGRNAEPLFISLKSNQALRELDLSHCKLEDGLVSQLGKVLPTITNLASLNLSSNLLTSASMSTLASVKHASLNELSVSGNMFDDFCLSHITAIIENSPLSILKLSRCNLTKSLFNTTDKVKFSTTVRNSKLKHLDVSYNNLTSGLEALLTSLPAGLLSLDLSGCSLDTASGDLVVSGLLSHCCRESVDLESLNISSLHLSDVNIERLCSGLKNYQRLTSLTLDHNHFTSSGLAFLMEAAVMHSLPLTRLKVALDFSSDFWRDEKSVEVISYKLREILDKNCTKLIHFIVPSPKDGLASYFTKEWNAQYSSNSKHHRDGFGNLVLCID